MTILVLGLGNELLSDDGAGILAVRRLKEDYKGQAVIVESSLSGLALLEYFIGYDKAIIVDAIRTNRQKPGTISELLPSDIGEVYAPSPHYSGLPELLAIAKQLDLDFPTEIKIFALEVEDPYTLGEGLTKLVEQSLASLIAKIKRQLEIWERAA
jgi:hydrogenase maturation protease